MCRSPFHFCFLCFVLFAVLFGSSWSVATAQDQVRIDTGLLQGVLLDSTSGLRVFRGIPYAAPPIGESRWRPPQPAASWEGVKAADEFGKACPQSPVSTFLGGETPSDTSEDCLHLNVWTCAAGPEAALPVVVWIHGGGFIGGFAHKKTSDGSAFAQKGVVFVSMNYRLGPFGFLAHPDLSAESDHGVSGNYAFLDQLAALRWVRRNIAAFGGDPEKVTIVGQSAGATSVFVLCSSPLARGLFRGAIAQSTYVTESLLAPLRAEGLRSAEAIGEELAGALVASSEQPTLEALRALPAGEVWRRLAVRFQPVIAVDGWLLPQSPEAQFAAGLQQDVPLIVGTTADDGSVFVDLLPYRTAEEFREGMKQRYGAGAADVLERYPVSADADVRPQISRMITEDWFLRGTRTMLRGTSRIVSPAWQYEFARMSPSHPELGAHHSLDVPYALGNLGSEVDAVDLNLASLILGYWVQFVRTGDPNREGLPEWPSYDPASEKYLRLGEKTSVGTALRAEAREPAERAASAVLVRGEHDDAKLGPDAPQRADLPDAAAIIERFVDITRWTDMVERTASRYHKGKIKLAAFGMEGTLEEWRAKPGKYVMNTNFAGFGNVMRGVDGKVGWSVHPTEGNRLLEGSDLVWETINALYAGPAKFAELYEVAETVGQEIFDGVECYKLKLVAKSMYHPKAESAPESRTSYEYYEVESGLKRGSETIIDSAAGRLKVLTLTTQYKDFKGTLFATRTLQRFQGLEIESSIESVTFDGVKDSVFELPQSIRKLLHDSPPR